METRHIKFDYEQALNAKKELLSSQLNLLQMIKKLKSYKAIRRKEFVARNKLRTQFYIIKTNINLIQSTFPKHQSEKIKVKNKIEKEHKQDIQNDLEDIKQKLAQLR